jgi:hypothetical protein
MLTVLIVLGIVFYIIIALWVIFVGLVGQGIPIANIVIDNPTTLIIVVITVGLFWPILLFVPIVETLMSFFRSF